MNKQELVAKLAERAERSKLDVEYIMTEFQALLIDTIASGEEVKLIGLGTFSKVKVKSRLYRNPQTGETVKAPASNKVKFKCHETFKKHINKKLK